jgi:hypothetical protein
MMKYSLNVDELIIILFFYIIGYFFVANSCAQIKEESSSLVIARVKYSGGGDWYNDPSAIPNMANYIKTKVGVDIAEEEAHVSILDESLFSYPILFLTGHGRILLSDEEVLRLRTYLLKGGFLYVDDDYGMDKSFRSVMKKIFPERELIELSFSHGIYHIYYRFENGLPKIHEHDNHPPQGFGIQDDNNRVMVFYTYETNISDGWADPQVHKDPPEKREAAFKMGVNILVWALQN